MNFKTNSDTQIAAVDRASSPAHLARLARPQSRNDLWERSVNIIRGTKVIVEHARNVKMVLGTSKGRDKICSMIQYTAKLVHTCNIYSNIPLVQEQLQLLGKDRDENLLSARISSTMSKNRKIFKLFKFIDELYEIMRVARSTTTSIEQKFFDIMAHFCAFCNFLLDNIIWMINTRILGQDSMLRILKDLQYFRYVSALWRTFFNFVFSIMQLRSYKR